MIQIEDKIISRELFENHFVCDLHACLGSCCIHGDSGAPLEDEEAEKLTLHLEEIKPFLREKSLEAISLQGSWVIDGDGDKVTPLIGHEECSYVMFEDNIARCAIEKAYEEGAVDFRKPVSCHLYPIRVTKLGRGMALNYHNWGICEPARSLGNKQGVPVFRFLKDAIQRVYGEAFYEELELVYKTYYYGKH